MTFDISTILSALIDGSSFPAEAASQICAAPSVTSTRLPADGKDTVEVEGFFWGLWGAVIDAAEKNPDAQGQLVKLVVELSNRGSAQPTWRIWGQEQAWKDLPLIGAAAREQFNGFDPSDSEEVERWVLRNAFLARLTEAKRLFMLYAIWSLRDALEEEASTSVAMKSGNVRAAAQWIKYAGQKIYNSTEEFPSGPQIGAPARGGPKWKGKHGFDPERWALWKREFRKLSTDKSIDELGSKDALEAAERMSQIEGKA
ncbi:hypothetical protein BDN71DRAFT_1456648 [Pleurotus eryngii]|uniref:Uncharacterized protein n=1 Tax=Pleurotus eryngii TaxID=5323 RepID=A0A9P5ZIQ4_PLEER|nr:hypothetical protein BDN71DRAFT_1456648 [Pleurotus eryngii]KAG5221782.1 heterokaryon incompatibility protein [Salix suchowensis]